MCVCTFELAVRRVLEWRSRSKVDDFDFERPRVHHDVLVFDVSVHNTLSVNELQSLHNLPEEPDGRRGHGECYHESTRRHRLESNGGQRVEPEGEAFRQRSGLSDEVKQILTLLWPFQHQQEALPLHLEPVQHADDPLMTADL